MIDYKELINEIKNRIEIDYKDHNFEYRNVGEYDADDFATSYLDHTFIIRILDTTEFEDSTDSDALNISIEFALNTMHDNFYETLNQARNAMNLLYTNSDKLSNFDKNLYVSLQFEMDYKKDMVFVKFNDNYFAI